jgi:hypothetical protein
MTSASTLARRARAEKNPKKAKALRARAAEMRREARKRPATPVHSPRKSKTTSRIMKGLKQALEHATNVDANPLHIGWEVAKDAEGYPEIRQTPPGHGEIVGGKLAKITEDIAKLARKKGGLDEIQNQLAQMERIARFEGARDADIRHAKERVCARQEMRDRIVCAFLATVDSADKQHAFPQVWTISGVTVREIVDALYANGYTPQGKN